MPFPILSSLIVLPIVGALALLLIRDDEERAGAIRGVAMAISGVVFVLSLVLWLLRR